MDKSDTRNEYLPDEVSPPGETLQETLESLGMSQAELAERIGRPKKTINEIVKGKAAITPETAIQLERALGVPASFWNAREKNFREYLARREEDEQLAQHLGWLKQFPLKAMIALGWVRDYAHDKVRQIRELLNFFGVASPAQWEEVYLASIRAAHYRQSQAYEPNVGAIAAWLRKGESVGVRADCAPFNRRRFELELHAIRKLTREPPEVFVPDLQRRCAAAGVAVVFVPELPKSVVSGATRWLNASKALIQLSLRYKSDDHLWFTFFHEACHVLNHGKKELFLEFGGKSSVSDAEAEADRYAASFLIPPSAYEDLRSRSPFSKEGIRRFAEEIGVAPGIVVGRLQHDQLPHSHCNDLKRRLDWADPAPDEP